MVSKIIHCVWLSGEEMPENYRKCVDSWRKIMPDYEIKMWTKDNLPKEVIEHPWVKETLSYRKWAYATDYIRLWVLYTFGGIYMDTDVLVFKPFDEFLKNRFFSCAELDPRYLYKTVNKKEIIGIGLEAAIMGSERKHPFVKDVMKIYDATKFVNNYKFWFNFIMPRVMTRVLKEKYGYRPIPNYQVLKEDIHIYSSDTFSSLFDLKTAGKNVRFEDLGENPLRYAVHMCLHSWWEAPAPGNWWKLKHFLLKLMGKVND